MGKGVMILFLAVTSVISVLANTSVAGKCRLNKASSETHDLDFVVVKLVMTLHWSSVTLLLDNVTDLENAMLNRLHQSNISTVISLESITMVTENKCGKDLGGGFVVLGTFLFVKNVFYQVAQCAERTNQSIALHTTQWLAVMAEEDIQHSQHVLARFENVAVLALQEGEDVSLWTLRHERGDVSLTFVTSLSPFPPLTRHRVLPNLSFGLGGRTLRVVTKESTYMMMRSSQSDSLAYEGVIMDILQELSVRLNFSYLFVPAADDSWGQKLDNGQWDGAIGMLTRKEADVAAGTFVITPGRTSVADVTTPFMYTNAVIMYHQREYRKAKGDYWRFFVQPLDTWVYVVMGICFLLVLLLLLVIEKCQTGLPEGQKVGLLKTKVTSVQWIITNLEILFAGLLNRCHAQEMDFNAGGVLVVTWLLLSMVLASVYSSKLTSSMTVDQQTPPFTSLAQLVRQDTYTWGYLGFSSTEAMLKTSTIQEFQQFYQGVVQFAKTDPSIRSADEQVHLDKVLHDNYAFFSANSHRYNVLAAEHCDIMQLPDAGLTSAMGFFLQKGSPYTKLISDQIGLMVDSGLIDYWERKWKPARRQCEPEEGQDDHVIDLIDTQTAFYLTAVGIGVATVALWLERIYGFMQRKREKK